MIPPDREIFEVESRIAARRAQLKQHRQEAGTRAVQALASPMGLVAAAGLGFVAAAAVAKRQQRPRYPKRRESDHIKAAKATGLAGILLPVATWLVRAQWGSPAKAAQFFLEKFQRSRARVSSRTDRRRDAVRVTAP